VKSHEIPAFPGFTHLLWRAEQGSEAGAWLQEAQAGDLFVAQKLVSLEPHFPENPW